MPGWWNDIARWGQINLREIDPVATDATWWADYWADCGVGAVTINAGGIVAYYPTEVPHHRRSPYLDGRDLFGDVLQALRAKGMRVLARFSATRQHAGMYYAHPDWFTRDADGQPVTEVPVGRETLYHVCNSGPFHYEWLPSVVDEVLREYHPDGIFCNVWTGPRGLCYCPRCRRLFRAASGHDLPTRLTPGDPKDSASRRYVDWRYALNLQWVDFMRQRVKAHNPEGTFIVNQHSWTGSASNQEDLRGIARRSEVIDSDFQGRGLGEGGQPIWGVGENGRVLRAAVGRGPDAAIPCGLTGAFEGWRLMGKHDAEQTVWLGDMAAAGTRVWVHFVGAASGGLYDDPRRFEAPRAFLQWHQENDDCFRDLDSLAQVAILLSKPTTDYYYGAGSPARAGSERGGDRGMAHVRGFGYALMRAGIPYDFLHDADLLEAEAPDILARYRVLILPNAACLSDRQAEVIRQWVQNGGGLISTFETGRFTEDLQPRADSVLADVFGAIGDGSRMTPGDHWYVRFEEEGAPLRQGLEAIRFTGGAGDVLTVNLAGRGKGPERPAAALTFLPPIPTMPPEAPYFTVERTERPVAALNTFGAGRSVYFPFALDALAWRRTHPDHLTILANAIRWAADFSRPRRDDQGEDSRSSSMSEPITVSSSAVVDFYPYRQPDGTIVLHLVNVSHPNAWRGPIDRLTPIGPVTVTIPERYFEGRRPQQATLRRAGEDVPLQSVPGAMQITIPAIRDVEAIRLI